MPHFRSMRISFCILTAALASCSAPSHGANESFPDAPEKLLADENYLAALRDEFLEVSGEDSVEFRKGSAALQPAAAFRLERQALWLRAYPMISVRLAAGGDGLQRVPDRRLARARGLAVRKHLIEFGVQAHQISGIDIAPSVKDSRQKVTTRIDLIQTALDE